MKNKKLFGFRFSTKGGVLIAITSFSISILLLSEYFLGRWTVGYDQFRQYVVAKQLSLGNGFTFPKLNIIDLSSALHEPFAAFPPGLSLITAPLFAVFKDVWVVHLILIFTNLCVFIILINWLLKVILEKRFAVVYSSLMLLFLVVLGKFTKMSFSTDFVCLNIYILSAILLIKYFKEKKNNVSLIVICFLLPLTILFRYAYLPALFVLPTFFIWRIIVLKIKETRAFAISVVSIVVFSVPIFHQIYELNSDSQYIEATSSHGMEGKLYFENIKYATPFPMSTFFDHIPVLRALGYTSEYGYDRGYEYPFYLQLLFYLFSLLLLTPIFLMIRKSVLRLSPDHPIRLFVLFSTIFSLGLVAMIFISSLIVPSQNMEYTWSWAMVERYYFLPMLTIILLYFITVINSKNHYLRGVVLIVFFISTLFSIGQTGRNYLTKYRPFDFHGNNAILSSNNILVNSYFLLKNIKRNNGIESVLFMDSKDLVSFQEVENFMGVNDITVGYVDKLDWRNMQTSDVVDVYMIVVDHPSKEMTDFQELYKPKLYVSLDENISIYHFLKEPDAK